MNWASTEEICEALVRHLEVTGSEVLGKHFTKDGKILCAVWCMVGPNAEEFWRMVDRWLTEKGFKMDPRPDPPTARPDPPIAGPDAGAGG